MTGCDLYDILNVSLGGGVSIRGYATLLPAIGLLVTILLVVGISISGAGEPCADPVPNGAGSGSASVRTHYQRVQPGTRAGTGGDMASLTGTVLIDALHFDGYESYDADEAFRLTNIGAIPIDIGDWSVADNLSETTFPAGTVMGPGHAIWCAQQATGFERQFGFKADFEYGGDSDPTVPDLAGTEPKFANYGDICILSDATGTTADVLVYKGGDASIDGWKGDAVEPWTSGHSFAAEGQILYRKRDQASGQPVPDTGTRADWAQDPNDPINGRKVRYPGWDLDAFFFTQQVTETATLTVAVAPDNLFETLQSLLQGAEREVLIAGYSFRSRELASLLLERLDRGVEITLLLEGAPAFDGVTAEERWIVSQLWDHGARVLFMVNNAGARVHDRYTHHHAKYMILDGRTVLVGSENMNPSSMPADDKSNGTAGRRGVYLATDSPGVVSRVRAVFDVDADPVNHPDLVDCNQAPDLCTASPGVEPDWTPDWTTYTVRFPEPFSATTEMAFEVLHSPENSLRDQDSLLGLLSRAGAGDTVLAEQFYE